MRLETEVKYTELTEEEIAYADMKMFIMDEMSRLLCKAHTYEVMAEAGTQPILHCYAWVMDQRKHLRALDAILREPPGWGASKAVAYVAHRRTDPNPTIRKN